MFDQIFDETLGPESVPEPAARGAISFERAAAEVRAFTATQGEPPLAAAIFGSVARGTNGPSSDIDVLLVTQASVMTKMNALHRGHRIQLVDGSPLAIRKKVGDVPRSGNSFILDALIDSRLVCGSEALLADLKAAAARIAAAGAPPLKRELYLSVRSRCADAMEKLAATADPHQRMFVAARIFSLLHELAAAANQAWMNIGASAYPQFAALAPDFAPHLAALLRAAIVRDDYSDFIDATRAFFERSGEFSWACERLRI